MSFSLRQTHNVMTEVMKIYTTTISFDSPKYLKKNTHFLHIISVHFQNIFFLKSQ